jgi:H+/Cl- antiporter ClcA
MTAAIILLEMTGAVAFTLPLVTAAVLAYETSRRIVPVSIYEALAQGFLRSEPRELS